MAGYEAIKVFGNSKGMIKWEKRSTQFNPFIVLARMRRIRILEQTFIHISYMQLYREQKWAANSSKRGVMVEAYKIHFVAFKQGILINEGNIDIK